MATSKVKPKRVLNLQSLTFPLTSVEKDRLLVKLNNELETLQAARDAFWEKGEMGLAWEYEALAEESNADSVRVAFNGDLWGYLVGFSRQLHDLHDSIKELRAELELKSVPTQGTPLVMGEKTT